MGSRKPNRCCVENCQNAVYVKKHKLCNAHYLRYIRQGDVGEGFTRYKRNHKPFPLKDEQN